MKPFDLEKIRNMLCDMVNNKLQNYIVPGVISQMIGDGGTKFGKVRMFHASREARDFVTPHSHRFNFCGIVLAGAAHNTLYTEENGIERDLWCRSTITQVCGAEGICKELTHLRETSPTSWVQHTARYVPGEVYSMGYGEIHSIYFEKGTEILILEGPEMTRKSMMIEPWVDGKCVPTFRVEPWMFEREI